MNSVIMIGRLVADPETRYSDATEERTEISVIEIWCECFRSPITRITRRDSYDIAAMLMRLGWERTGKRRRVSDYGLQRVFVRR
jgi:putative DNA primase/helicase